MNIMVIEDEAGLQLGLTDLFEEAGHHVDVHAQGRVAIERMAASHPDLVVLDLGLPDMDGTQILEHINQHYPETPVLVLTSRANDADIVLGFKLGAYDYVTKPFSPRVLLARVEALIQRKQSFAREIDLGDIHINFDRYEAFANDEPIHLTTREFEILKFLYQFKGKPVSRHDILDEVWGMDSEAGPRTVDTHVALLRKKIEPNPDKPTFLLSRRGIGYKLVVKPN